MITAAPRRRAATIPVEPLTVASQAMGGRLLVHLGDTDDPARGLADARRAQERIRRWAGRLTRHGETSELISLNSDPRPEVPVGPTLAAALRAARIAGEQTEGLVDISLLDALLAAEHGPAADHEAPAGAWDLTAGQRGTAVVRRPVGLRFDLGGVGKGWIADRAVALLGAYTSVAVDADGDLAVRVAPGRHWEVAVGDPRGAADLQGHANRGNNANPGTAGERRPASDAGRSDRSLAILRLAARSGDLPGRWGVATSGISVHRWGRPDERRHHLIDPRTGRPAVTDVVQATVVAGTAARAEALAKAAVIAGSGAGLALLERSGVRGAILLTDRDEVVALPSTLGLLAD